jgi:Gpi18-like mannosyltransferase
MRLETSHPGAARRVDLASSFAAWDGEWYVKIASSGYEWDCERMSSVAFFPAYPALAAIVQKVTGCRTEWALLVVSHGALLGCFVLLGSYVRKRFPEASVDLPEYSLLALGLFPTTFWMRMCYTESLFLFAVLLAMFGMQLGWRPLWVALVIGFATATRSSGVALVPVFCWWLWHGSEGQAFVQAARKAIVLLPVCVWGLLASPVKVHCCRGNR